MYVVRRNWMNVSCPNWTTKTVYDNPIHFMYDATIHLYVVGQHINKEDIWYICIYMYIFNYICKKRCQGSLTLPSQPPIKRPVCRSLGVPPGRGSCPLTGPLPFDLIYTDYHGLQQMKQHMGLSLRKHRSVASLSLSSEASSAVCQVSTLVHPQFMSVTWNRLSEEALQYRLIGWLASQAS